MLKPESIPERRRSLAGTAALAASLLFLLAAPGWAATVNLSCPGGPSGPFPSINAAVAAVGNTAGCTITVTGTSVEPASVYLWNVRALTIEALPASTATIIPPPDNDGFDIQRSWDIVLRRLTISGPTGSTFGYGVNIFDHSQVTLDSCTVSGWVDVGVGLDGDSSAFIRNSTFQNNGDGADITGGSSVVISNSALQNNAFVGVFVYDRSAAVISGQSTISGNSDTGVFVQDLSRLQVAGKTVIENNRFAGVVGVAQSIVRMSGQTKVRNNGCNDDPSCAQSLTGGIYLLRNSTFRGAGTLEISGNIGNGVTAEQGIDAAFSDTKFNNNTGDGLKILRISNGSLISGNTFSGNGGASFSCDTTSLVSGDVTGITNFSCKQIERVNGPPRSGKFKQPNP